MDVLLLCLCMCYEVSGLWGELITRSVEPSECVCVLYVYVCVRVIQKSQQLGGQGPNWAVSP